MDLDYRKRLKDLIDQTPGLTMKGISLKAGLGPTAVNDIVTRGQDPSIDRFIAIANAAGVSPIWLLQGDENFKLSIPVVGILEAAEVWTPTKDGREAPLDFGVIPHDTISLEVRGNAMAPVYKDGDFIVCNRAFGPNVDNLINRDCAVRLQDGRHMLKILKRGKPGRVTLRSYNSAVDDIEDVQIAWAAPVVWIRRGGS